MCLGKARRGDEAAGKRGTKVSEVMKVQRKDPLYSSANGRE